MAKNKMADNPIHTMFNFLPIKDTCTWHGTEWAGEGKDAYCLPCGEPTVAAGAFCFDKDHDICAYHSLCERHSYTSERWE